MQFSTVLTVFLSLASSTLAAPVDLESRALKSQPYNTFQVSSGVGGNALAEVNKKFPVNLSNLKAVSASDLSIISKAAQVSEQAEVGKGGFNEAIAKAGGTGTTAGAALQVGKIKNKVLKLQTDVLRIQIQTAQGNTASTASLPAQMKKLATNVALDVKNKGKKATAVNFAG